MYQWPIVDDRLIAAVAAQLRDTLSDKGSSGVIKRTEEKLAAFHGAKYCLLFSSATGAMHSLTFALDLKEGDAILAPGYTFFATSSPFAYEGVDVIQCDVNAWGQIDVDDVRRKLTPKARAVVCTHMWGVPCDMTPLVAFCADHGLDLIEDCSHAHVARYQGQRVGTFGSAAVFSTNQKFLTSGEGGYLLTNDRNIYERCLLLAHYNERCQNEVTTPELRAYALTGMGLKYRAHPLAVAILADQLDRIDDLVARRRRNYQCLAAAVDVNPALQNLTPPYDHFPGLYVFPFLLKDPAQRGDFMCHCIAMGNSTFDIPGSTKPLDGEPLFSDKGGQVRRRTRGSVSAPQTYLPGAARFHSSIVKLPLWGHDDDGSEVEAAVEALRRFGR
jgi:perosamine synthetase